MILLTKLSLDDLQPALNDKAQKMEFERIVLKTRFEEYSEYLWFMMNAFKKSFAFDLIKDTATRSRKILHYNREMCELFSFISNRKAKGSVEIEFKNRSTEDKVTVTNPKLVDDIFLMLRHNYICNVDDGFDPCFDPDELGGSVYAGRAKSSHEPEKRQNLALNSIDDAACQLAETHRESGKRGAPYKNTRIYCALLSIAAVCEPNYNANEIEWTLGVLKEQRGKRMRDALEDISVYDVIFNNDVSFSNGDCKVIYEILDFFGYLRSDEEFDYRDNARFIRQIMIRSNVVRMPCLFCTDFCRRNRPE